MVSHHLYISLPSGTTRKVKLAGVTLIGRDSQNDIVLEDVMISRYHAMLFTQPQGAVLVDLESTNGTLVDGTLVLPDTPVPLTDGTLIALGAVIARYHEEC